MATTRTGNVLCMRAASLGVVAKSKAFESLSRRHIIGSRRLKSTVIRSSNSSEESSSSFYQSAQTNAVLFDKEHGYTHTRYDLFLKSNNNREPIRGYPKRPQTHFSQLEGIPLPPYARTGMVSAPDNSLFFTEEILIHDDDESVERMKKAAGVARRVLDYACSLAQPNITTDEIDQLVHDKLLASGAYPSPLNYAGFPKSLCSSVNEVICHGIPDSRPLQPGDIVSFDVSCFTGGVHGDNCATVIIPPDNKEDDEEYIKAQRLVQATSESLAAAISTCRPGSCLTQVGAAIHDVADAYGYDTVRKYRGHGIGSQFHCAPFVKHFRNSDYLQLQEGMIFTIEPMLTEGDAHDCHEWPEDGWTVTTIDSGRAAQFEHTVLITKDGVEIITVPDN